MALAEKGSRRIVVDSVVYRWRLRRRPTYCQGVGWTPCSYAVEREGVSGTVLVVRTDKAHPGNWIALPRVPVLPSEVARTIRLALSRGWDPQASGAPFILDLSKGFTASP
ncbi:hypothetical protein [Yinghuangia sp. YIM S09857]|uniref:hypothetical protein n=1 Tax=Yinghuangia sp. YIM S09857 TaxID=3436929 RepID=UPI003F539396